LTPGPYQVELDIVYDRKSLAAEWQALETEACASFFLSWTWISTWLDSLAMPPILVRVRSGPETAALGLLVQANIRRHHFVRSRQLHLHQTGDEDLDRIATEFNGFLIRRGAEKDVVTEIFRKLPELLPLWDECVLPGVPAYYMALAECAGYVGAVDRRSPNFIVDLDHLRQLKADLTLTMSRNGRAQLRRALRLAGTEGPLTIDPASDLEEALSYFAALKQLDRWESKGQSGAFATAARELFHRRLIARGLARGEVQLLCGRAGSHLVGYLYQFSYRGKVLSYQAGFVPRDDNRHRPGLVMHYLAIERAKAQGAISYDLLAGQARYKRSLAEEGEELVWCRLQRPRLRFTLERTLRRLRNAI
jgi:CelD/BcsL family acetyltransferase involved in cellulose biosynthesis